MQPQILSSGLYKITNLANGKMYIGICKKNPIKRFSAHVYASRKGSMTALSCAIRKYGVENFSVEQLVIAEYGDFLKDMEVKAISIYNTKAPHGYNMTNGGDGAVGAVPEVIEKIKQGRLKNPPVLTKEGKKSISEACIKRWADPEQKALISEKIRIRLSNPEVHQKRCESIKKAALSEKGRKIKVETSKNLWATKEYRDKVIKAAKEGCKTPEAKANRSMAAKLAWAKRKVK